MLQFFRKYQKFFFFFITIIIVCTFVFFGTYQALAPSFQNREKDEVTFRTLSGTKIYKSYLDKMERFLDTENWMSGGRAGIANFLNDGLISKDFLETGLGLGLLPYLTENFNMEIDEKLEKEKLFVPYAHPLASQLSAMSVWSLFAPEIPERLGLWKNLENGHDKKAFQERMALFLAQKKFPPSFLAQVIRYQQREYLSYGADPRLMKDDLGLFGYSSMTDWFGSEFMHLVCKSVIETAEIARKKGYSVSKEELYSELVASSQKMYETLREKCDLPVSDGHGLFQLYLRQNGYDEASVLKIWEDVTLFRKYLSSVAAGGLVDLLGIQNFYAYAHENVSIELYQLAEEFRFQTLEDLMRFETYIEAVGVNRNSALDLPVDYAPLAEIEKRAPELIGKRYRIFIASADKDALKGKVSLKETWGWECDPQNWAMLKAEFPVLANKSGDAVEILEKVDPKTRRKIDTFACKQIVSLHPEWLKDLLKDKSLDEKELFITAASENILDGIKDPVLFKKMLDENDELVDYTQDNDHFYRILVQERSCENTILTFKEALSKNVLDKIAQRLKVEEKVDLVLKEIASRFQQAGDPSKSLPYRLATFLEKKTMSEGELAKQWKVEKREKTLTRSEPSFLAFDQVAKLEPGTLSRVLVDQKEGPYYYKVLNRKMDTSIPLEKVAQAEELLGKEIKCNVFDELLKKFMKTKC